MSNKHIIGNGSLGHKRRLMWRNQIGQERLKPLSEDLGSDLIVSGTQSYRMIVRHFLWNQDLQNESNMSLIMALVKSLRFKEALYLSDYILSDKFPKGMVKGSRKPVIFLSNLLMSNLYIFLSNLLIFYRCSIEIHLKKYLVLSQCLTFMLNDDLINIYFLYVSNFWILKNFDGGK